MSFKRLLPVCLIVCLPLSAAAQSAQDAIPRTAWGAPDLQGVYDFGTATPFQRPAELAGRATFTAEEAAVQEQINAAQFAEGLNTENLTPPNYNNFWFDNGSGVLETRQSSLIVDPPDGRLPDFTPQEERKAAAELAAGGYPVRVHFGGIGSDGPEDRGLAERCLLASTRAAAHAERLQQLHAGVPDARPRGDLHGDGARGPHRAARRARPSDAQRPAVARRRARPLGRRHAGDRDGELPARSRLQHGRALPRTQRADAAHRAADARRRGHAALRVHLRRRGGVRQHVLGVDPAAPHEQRRLRVRLPRGQLRPDEHSRGARAPRRPPRGTEAAPSALAPGGTRRRRALP